MSDVTVALIGIGGVLVTYVIAPRLAARREQKVLDVEHRRTEALTLAQNTDDRLNLLLKEQALDRERLIDDVRARDRRIAKLEIAVEALQDQLGQFRAGLVAPLGFVVVPQSTWASVRSRLSDLDGIYVGEIRRAPIPQPINTEEET